MAKKNISKVTLYIPGLFHFIPEFEETELSDLMTLRRFLTYGKARSIESKLYLDQLADFFQVKTHYYNDTPWAALSRLIDETIRPDGCWMRVDPVHLKPSPKGLTLMDGRQFSLSQHDALALAAGLTEEFKRNNCELEVPVPNRWYLKLPNTPIIKTHPIQHVAGKSITEFMLDGEHKQTWLKLFNQIQMLLHDSQINEQRTAKGEPAINSLWFWGVGELPETLERIWSGVYSDDSIIKGLCMLSSAEYSTLKEFELPNDNQQLIGNYLINLSAIEQAVQYDEPMGWLESVREIESRWLTLMESLLKQSVINQLEIYTEGYCLEVSCSALKQFWKRPKKLKSFFV